MQVSQPDGALSRFSKGRHPVIGLLSAADKLAKLHIVGNREQSGREAREVKSFFQNPRNLVSILRVIASGGG